MGRAHREVVHRMLLSRSMRSVCRPSKLALHTDFTGTYDFSRVESIVRCALNPKRGSLNEAIGN